MCASFQDSFPHFALLIGLMYIIDRWIIIALLMRNSRAAFTEAMNESRYASSECEAEACGSIFIRLLFYLLPTHRFRFIRLLCRERIQSFRIHSLRRTSSNTLSQKISSGINSYRANCHFDPIGFEICSARIGTIDGNGIICWQFYRSAWNAERGAWSEG